jgi:hypothetical protein
MKVTRARAAISALITIVLSALIVSCGNQKKSDVKKIISELTPWDTNGAVKEIG